MNNTECIRFEELAPEDIQRDLNQCNSACRQVPTMGKIGSDWIVSCLCSSTKDKDMLQALLVWNRYNLIKRITPSTKLAALRELNRKIKEKGNL